MELEKPTEKDINVLFSYHENDRTSHNRFVSHFQEAGIQPISDEVTERKQYFDPNYQESLATFDYVLIFISEKYLSLSNLIEKEIPEKILPFKNRGVHFYYILLKHCQWMPVPWIPNEELWPNMNLPLSQISQNVQEEKIQKFIKENILPVQKEPAKKKKRETAQRKKSDTSEDRGDVPSEKEIAQLPRWAQVAFAARCARRVQPLFTAFWPDAPKKHIEAVDHAISMAEESAVRGGADTAAADPAAANAAAASAAAVSYVAVDVAAAAYAAVCAATNAATAVSYTAAANDHTAAYAADAADAAARVVAAVAAARSAAAKRTVSKQLESQIISGIRRDFDVLVQRAKKNKWNDKTPVGPKVFGPMWPDGEPDWKQIAVRAQKSKEEGQKSTKKKLKHFDNRKHKRYTARNCQVFLSDDPNLLYPEGLRVINISHNGALIEGSDSRKKKIYATFRNANTQETLLEQIEGTLIQPFPSRYDSEKKEYLQVIEFTEELTHQQMLQLGDCIDYKLDEDTDNVNKDEENDLSHYTPFFDGMGAVPKIIVIAKHIASFKNATVLDAEFLIQAIAIHGLIIKAKNTPYFLYTKIKYPEAIDTLKQQMESFTNKQKEQAEKIQLISQDVRSIFDHAKAISESTTRDKKISGRHLLGGLLVYSRSKEGGDVFEYLKTLGIDSKILIKDYLDYMRTETEIFSDDPNLASDSYEEWEKILIGQEFPGYSGPISTPEPGAGDATEMETENCCVGDGKTRTDYLGFKPYVEAVAQFLTHDDTELPLTLSIEGEWGSGKSSFMVQLEDEIKRIGTENGNETLIVKFDPWRYDKKEALWAAFAISFLSQIRGGLSTLRHWSGNWSLFRMRYNWKDGWLDICKLVTFWIAFIFLSVFITFLTFKRGPEWVNHFREVVLVVEDEIAESSLAEKANSDIEKNSSDSVTSWGIIEWALGGTGLCTMAAGLGSLFGLVKKLTGNPFEVNLKKHIEHPDYVGQASFLERFHDDFHKIVSAYAGKNRVYVFIDDLDRCAVPKAAELMSSINLMLSEEPNLVFIIAMDREKVAAGLAVKHEKLLPYLSSHLDGEGGTDDKKPNPIVGIRYGYSFIEKFIQVPFTLPRPTEDAIERMLMAISSQQRKKEKANVAN